MSGGADLIRKLEERILARGRIYERGKSIIILLTTREESQQVLCIGRRRKVI